MGPKARRHFKKSDIRKQQKLKLGCGKAMGGHGGRLTPGRAAGPVGNRAPSHELISGAGPSEPAGPEP